MYRYPSFPIHSTPYDQTLLSSWVYLFRSTTVHCKTSSDILSPLRTMLNIDPFYEIHIKTHWVEIAKVNSITLLTLFDIALILILGLHTFSRRQRSITLQLGPTPGMEAKVTATLAPSTCMQSLTEAHNQLAQFNYTHTSSDRLKTIMNWRGKS